VKVIRSNAAILILTMDNVRGKITDLRALGFADPVMMITSNPTILSYAPERLLICGRMIMRFDDDAMDRMLAQLINQPRAVIDAVALARPRSWSDLRAIIVAGEERRGEDSEGLIRVGIGGITAFVPRAANQSRRLPNVVRIWRSSVPLRSMLTSSRREGAFLVAALLELRPPGRRSSATARGGFAPS
jgi:hypothetical protein